jgi:hypothetical protein
LATLAAMTGLCAFELSNKTYTHGLFLWKINKNCIN